MVGAQNAPHITIDCHNTVTLEGNNYTGCMVGIMEVLSSWACLEEACFDSLGLMKQFA